MADRLSRTESLKFVPNGVSEAQSMASSYVVDFRRSFFFLSFLFIHERVLPDITVRPLDSESLVNESTYFNCSSDITTTEIVWYHHPVGVEAHQRKSVYAYGKIYRDYEEDFVLEKNLPYGAYNLVIKSAKTGYAGQYECQEDRGYGSSAFAQLIIIDGEPECNSNISPDGVIGHNTCGIQPDELHLSCSISYHGNIPPDLKWIKSGEIDSISGTKGQFENRFTYNLTIKADLLEDKSSYVCQTTKSRTSTHSCTSETVKLLYMFNAPSISVRTVGEVVNCSAKTSSQSCQYKWKWYNKEDTLTVSDNRTLKLEKEGQHRCEATCSLRNMQCTVNASLINATIESSAAENFPLNLGSETTSADSSSSTSVVLGVLLSLLVVVIIVVLLIVLWICRRRNYKRKGNKADEARVEGGMNDTVNENSTQEEQLLLKTYRLTDETPKAEDEEGKGGRVEVASGDSSGSEEGEEVFLNAIDSLGESQNNMASKNCSNCFHEMAIPRELPCKHVFCMDCVKNVKERAGRNYHLSCPKCGALFSIAFVPKDSTDPPRYVREKYKQEIKAAQDLDIIKHNGKVMGMTAIGDELFVVCKSPPNVIFKYDIGAENKEPLKSTQLSISEMKWPRGIAGSEALSHLYITDWHKTFGGRLWRYKYKKGQETKQEDPVAILDVQPFGVSVSQKTEEVLVSCGTPANILWTIGWIYVYKPSGLDFLHMRTIELPDIEIPRYSIITPLSEFIVCHGWSSKSHGVTSYLDDESGRIRKKSFYGTAARGGSGEQEMNRPLSMIQDEDGFILVVDYCNNRIQLLTEDLHLVRHLITSGISYPRHICLHANTGRMYVGQEDGNVLIFDALIAKE